MRSDRRRRVASVLKEEKKKKSGSCSSWDLNFEARRMSGPSVDVVWDPQTQMNSLDCWDYSIELSCLQGPEGISK